MVTSSYGSLSSLQASSVRSRTLPSRWISLSILPPRHSRLPTSLNSRGATGPQIYVREQRRCCLRRAVAVILRTQLSRADDAVNGAFTCSGKIRIWRVLLAGDPIQFLETTDCIYAVYMYVYVQPLVQICELTQEQHLDCYVAFMLHSIQPCMPPEGKFSPSGVILEYYLNDLIHWSLGPKNCMQKMVSHHSSPCFVTALPHI